MTKNRDKNKFNDEKTSGEDVEGQDLENNEGSDERPYPMGLMILVIVLGIFLFVGFIIIFGTIIYKSFYADKYDNAKINEANIIIERIIDIDDRANIYDYKLNEKQLIIHLKDFDVKGESDQLKATGDDYIIIYDLRKNKITDRLRFE